MTKAKKSRAYQEGDIRYKCDFQGCTKSFTRKEHARRHFRSHTNSKAFICPHCSSSFTRSDVLNRHVNQKHVKQNDAGSQTHPKHDKTLISSSDQELPFPSYVEADVQDAAYTDLKSHIDQPILPDQPIISDNFNEGLQSAIAQTGNNYMFTTSRRNNSISGSITIPESDQQINLQNKFLSTPSIKNNANKSLSPQDSISIFGTSPFNAYQQNTDNFVCWLFDNMEKDAPTESVSNFTDGINAKQLNLMPVLDSPTIDFLSSHFRVDDKLVAKDLLSLSAYSSLIQVMNNNYQLSEEALQYITLSRVNLWIAHYWKDFHPRWPFLHRGTLKVDEAPVELLLAMITMGMHFVGDAFAYSIAVSIHSTLRFSIYTHPDFKPPASLWVYQALLIAEIFEKMTSTVEQHNLSQIFHGVTIESMQNGLSSKDTVTEKIPKNMTGTNIAQHKWHQWVDREASKRIAFFSFVLDSQHVILFGYRPLIDITSVGLPLLCDEALWNADSYEAWTSLLNENDPPHFFPVLKMFLTNEHLPPKLSPWNMMIVLHGLTTIGWILSRENLGIVENIMQNNGTNLKNWRILLKASYKFWLRTYRVFFLNNGTLPLNHPYVRGCLATYELAHISLHTNIVALQTYAKSIVSTSRRLYASTSRYVSAWLASDDSEVSIKHAVDMVEAFLGGDMEYDVQNETGLHRPWCLYVSTLILWAYGYVSDGRCEMLEPGNNDCKSQLNAYLMQMRTGLSEKAKDHVYVRSKTLPLLKCVIDVLCPARWGLLVDGVRILSKLVQL
ncbi:Zinc finger protein klf1 [Schizosaccharomyces pombe]